MKIINSLPISTPNQAGRKFPPPKIPFEDIFPIIDEMVLKSTGEHLSRPESIVLEGVWNDDSFQEMADRSGYAVHYLQKAVAPSLWRRLSKSIPGEKPIGKKNVRYILAQVTRDYFPQQSPQNKQVPINLNKLLQIKGSRVPEVSSFYGRAKELSRLKELITQNRCVLLRGVAGIGKTALAAKLLADVGLTSSFDCLVWKSTAHSPLCQDLVAELITLIQPEDVSSSSSNLPKYSQAMVSLLINQMQSRRCLIVLDEAESLFGTDLEQRQEYKIFFRRLIEELHQSCIILTSRVLPNELDNLIEADYPIQSLMVKGLDIDAGIQFLAGLGVTDPETCNELIQTYRGNPLELKTAITRTRNTIGDKEEFLRTRSTVFSRRLEEMLNGMFGQSLDQTQRQMMIYLAHEVATTSHRSGQQFLTFSELLIGLNGNQVPISKPELMLSLEKLEKSSLIEKSFDPATRENSYSLAPTIKKYISMNFIQARGVQDYGAAPNVGFG